MKDHVVSLAYIIRISDDWLKTIIEGMRGRRCQKRMGKCKWKKARRSAVRKAWSIPDELISGTDE